MPHIHRVTVSPEVLADIKRHKRFLMPQYDKIIQPVKIHDFIRFCPEDGKDTPVEFVVMTIREIFSLGRLKRYRFHEIFPERSHTETLRILEEEFNRSQRVKLFQME